MPSETFRRLYRDAYLRDCPIIRLILSIRGWFGELPVTNQSGVADAVHTISVNFLDVMDDFARRYNPKRFKRISYQCPGCGGAYCQDSIEIHHLQR